MSGRNCWEQLWGTIVVPNNYNLSYFCRTGSDIISTEQDN